MMRKTKASKSRNALRKSVAKAGVLPSGYGVLKGQYEVRPGIDVTKPIYEQALRLERLEKRERGRGRS